MRPTRSSLPFQRLAFRHNLCSLGWLVCASVLMASAIPLAVEAIEPGIQRHSVELAQSTTERSAEEEEFWARSQELIFEQFQAIQLLEEAMILAPEGLPGGIQLNGRIANTTQAERLELAREHLWLHLLELERFLRDRSIMPEFLCRDGLNLPPDFSPAQQQIYCSLFYTQQQLQPLVPLFDRHISLLDRLDPTPLTSSMLSIPVQLGHGHNSSPLSTSILVRESATPEPIVVGQPPKRPEATGEESLSALLIPNAKAIYAIETSRRLLLAAQNAFPTARNSFPPEMRSLTGNLDYLALYPEEAKQYEDVLAQPNTGIATILNAPSSPLDLNQLRDRLNPATDEALPLVPLQTLAYGFLPRLALKTEGDTLTISADSLTYGFIVDLGDDIDFEDFPDLDDDVIDWGDRDFNALSDAQRELFLNYRPPEKLRDIQADQRRFFFGKLGVEFLAEAKPPAVAYVPAQLNRTYLLRLIQYQLPEVILNNEPIHRSRRRHAARILQTPSSDLLIAFRPLRRNPDGSYAILWKIIDRFPEPKIIDLENYVDFQ
jgi:hypothetical protein